jgi:hypothetical protein
MYISNIFKLDQFTNFNVESYILKPEGTQAATTESLKQAQVALCFWAKQLEIDRSITFCHTIVDVLNQYWVGCSDGLAMWCWWWLR